MALTYGEVIDSISEQLWDTANAIWTDANILYKLTEALDRISEVSPVPVKHTLLTTASSRDLTLNAGHKYNLLFVGLDPGPYVEYPVGVYPEERINFTWPRNSDTITMLLDTAPAASGESVYVWLKKRHTLQASIGTTDTAGAIKTTAAAKAVSLALKSLGSGTINKDTWLTIAGDATVYTVYADATIAANEATVYITPPLAAQALADAVVTLALHDSTLDPTLEQILIKWTAGLCLISKASYFNRNINTASASTGQLTAQDGYRMLAEAKAELQAIAVRQIAVTLPRS